MSSLDKEKRLGPLIIHCSGGIGRSGTFTAVYSLYSLLRRYQEVGYTGQPVIYLPLKIKKFVAEKIGNSL